MIPKFTDDRLDGAKAFRRSVLSSQIPRGNTIGAQRQLGASGQADRPRDKINYLKMDGDLLSDYASLLEIN